MWTAISRLLLRIAALRWLFKLGGLGLLLPIAFLLKVVGLPLLMILMVLAIPVLIMLFVFGLPIFAVLIFGGIAMGVLGVVLTIGFAAIKIGLFVILPIWLIWKLGSTTCRWVCNRGSNSGDASSTDTQPDSATGSDTVHGTDPE